MRRYFEEALYNPTDGKLAEVWDSFDRLWIWQQLGVLPEIKGTIAMARETMLS